MAAYCQRNHLMRYNLSEKTFNQDVRRHLNITTSAPALALGLASTPTPASASTPTIRIKINTSVSIIVNTNTNINISISIDTNISTSINTNNQHQHQHQHQDQQWTAACFISATKSTSHTALITETFLKGNPSILALENLGNSSLKRELERKLLFFQTLF